MSNEGKPKSEEELKKMGIKPEEMLTPEQKIEQEKKVTPEVWLKSIGEFGKRTIESVNEVKAMLDYAQEKNIKIDIEKVGNDCKKIEKRYLDAINELHSVMAKLSEAGVKMTPEELQEHLKKMGSK